MDWVGPAGLAAHARDLADCARCARGRARGRGRALHGRVRRPRVRRRVPRASVSPGARRRGAPARLPVGLSSDEVIQLRARTGGRSARDAIRITRRLSRLLARPTGVPARLVGVARGVSRVRPRPARSPSCGLRRATRRSKRTRSTRTPRHRHRDALARVAASDRPGSLPSGDCSTRCPPSMPRSGCPGCWPPTRTCSTSRCAM
jgi:hypothetical protein